MKSISKKDQDQPPQGKRLSLSPLDFDEAITDLLKIAPAKLDAGPSEKKSAIKRGPAKRPTKKAGRKAKR